MSHGMALNSCLMLLLAMPVAGQVIVRDGDSRASAVDIRAIAVDTHGDFEEVPTTQDIGTEIPRVDSEVEPEVDPPGGVSEADGRQKKDEINGDVHLPENDDGDEEVGKDNGDEHLVDTDEGMDAQETVITRGASLAGVEANLECLDSPPHLCKMSCPSPPPTCGRGECAMRKGNCCEFTCQKEANVEDLPNSPYTKLCGDCGCSGEENVDYKNLGTSGTTSACYVRVIDNSWCGTTFYMRNGECYCREPNSPQSDCGDSKGNPNWGAVVYTIDTQACICQEDYKPKCYKGETFSNNCKLKCKYSDAKNKHIMDGECKACICTKNYNPKCYKGETFSNKCMLECKFSDAKKNDIMDGACKACACTKIYNPKCYKGETFSNNCKLKCKFSDAKNKDIMDGECKACACPRNYNPKCYKGETFSNKCMLKCKFSDAKNKDIMDGACKDTSHGWKCKNDGSAKSICGQHGYSFAWCRTTNDNWDYCSVDLATTSYGMTCKDDCSAQSACARHGEKYLWCWTYGVSPWDYCVKAPEDVGQSKCSDVTAEKGCIDRLDCAWNYRETTCHEKNGLVNLYLTMSNINMVIADTVNTINAYPSLNDAKECVVRAISTVLDNTDHMLRDAVNMQANIVCATTKPDKDGNIGCISNSGPTYPATQAPEAQLDATKIYLKETVGRVQITIKAYELIQDNKAIVAESTMDDINKAINDVAASASAVVNKARRMNRIVNRKRA